MTLIKDTWVLQHFDWYTHDPEKGLQPTEKAPPEAVEALKNLNEHNLKYYGAL